MNRKLIIGIIIAVIIAALAITTLFVVRSTNSFEHQLERGYKHLEDEHYEEAIAAFEKALDIDDDNFDVYMGLAEAYIELEEIEDAIEALEDAVEIEDDYEDVADIMEAIAEGIVDEMDSDDREFQDVFDDFVGIMEALDDIDENDGFPKDIEKLLVMGDYYDMAKEEQKEAPEEKEEEPEALDHELVAEAQEVLSDPIIEPEVIETKVSAGGEHVLALKRDGSVWAWGSNATGQLGDGTQTTYNESYEMVTNNDTLVPIKIVENAMDISAGDDFTLILTRDNELYGCGSNVYGQLGLDEYINYPELTYIASDVISIEAGRELSAYITSDKELYLLGRTKLYKNYTIQDIEGEAYSNEPQFIMSNIQDVALASSLMMILTMDNELYVYGSESDYREMYDGEDSNYYRNEAYTETPIKLVDSVKSIDSGNQVYMYTDFDDTLYTWGANGYDGLLGTGTSEFSVIEHTAVLEDIIDYNQQIAINNTGDLYVWGRFANMMSFYSDQGNVGGTMLDGLLDYDIMPVKILENMEKCSHYQNTLYAIDNENNLYCWGINIRGQIGDGTITEIAQETISDGEYDEVIYSIADEQGKREPTLIMNLD